uniref:Uncharacterized protein n=1 Tax=Amphimedon queenslandica TaxID=400682 RepID=A0A1X7T6Q2_AMPQE
MYSIYSLVSAMRGIGENGVADAIDMEKHPACRILARYISKQSLVSALPWMTSYLYRAGLIKETKFTYVSTLDEMKEAVCNDYRKLEAFADILCKNIVTTDIGRAIIRDY